MVTGGRVVHHINNLAPDYRNTILLCGFQAEGTRGALIARKDKEIKIFGQMVPIKAKVIQLANTSAHVDYIELINWLQGINKKPREIFITHGELSASQFLASIIEKKYKWTPIIPEYLSKYTLS